jgi:anti-sigma regulatory factor (Ser/Thr protein kinase)
MSGGTGATSERLVNDGMPSPGRNGHSGAGTAHHWTAWTHVSVLEYPPVPEAVPSARHWAARSLRDWQLDDIADDALVALSELLTNAITASARMPGQPGVRVKLLFDPGQLVVEVFDQAAGIPEIRMPSWDEPGGRGLLAVAGLARRWDWSRTEDGKSVWCDFWL